MAAPDVWVGMASLRLASANPKRRDGFAGAFAGFACRASNIAEAANLLLREFDECGYELVGFEHMILLQLLDRDLTPYEKGLVQAVESYPVQFRDVHLHKGDG
jgi:hypothetical protein